MEGLKNTYYVEDAEKVIEIIRTDKEKGLTAEEANKRLQQYGKNIVERKKKISVLSTFLAQFSNPIVWILIFAATLAFSFGQSLEGIAVVFVILINAFIGFFMERQAVRSMEKLRNMARAKAKVLRDGKKIEIDSADLVPGDILFVESGDVVTADARIIAHTNLAVKEAALTGESDQVEKNEKPLPQDTPVADRTNSIFKGTIVSRGKGRTIVVGTGKDSELGRIVEMTEEAKKEATPLNKKLRILTRKLIWLTLILAALIFLAGLIRKEELMLLIKTAIALAIACIPEGLPVISTVSLARGMLRLAKKNVIVKTLEAVQTLGETEVIFTDKTGTLTENEMYVHSVAFNGLIENLTGEKNNFEKLKKHSGYKMFLKVGVLCNNSTLHTDHNKEKSAGDPVEVAFLRMANDLSENVTEIQNAHPRIDELPFDENIKMMATVNQYENKFLICVKGATEEVLKKCVRGGGNDEAKDLDHEKWKKRDDELANKGLRVLSFAYRISSESPTKDKLVHGLTFLGVAGFIDPPRPDIKKALGDCKQAGIKVVMITGDHPGTATAIAKEIGLSGDSEVVNVHGKELQAKKLSKEQKEKVLNANVFSRVDPSQKLKLVSVYQKKKFVVGMTGDGVNDAPALKKADIGIAMGIRGTEAAKEAADLILRDDAFASIVTAVKYGRIIFENVRTFIVYLLSCNVSEILIVAIAAFFNLPLPLLPLQILFLNMITDVFPALAIGMGEGEKGVMKMKPRKSSEPIISRSNWISIATYSLCLTAAVVGAEIYALTILKMDEKIVNNITFYTLILAQLWNVFNMPGKETSFIKNQITKNKYIWYALLLCVVITIIVYFIPVSRSALTLVTLEPSMLSLIVVASFIPVGLVQLLKRGFGIIK